MQGQRQFRVRNPKNKCDDSRQQIHQYPTCIVPEIRHLFVRLIRWGEQALAARAGDGEAFESELSAFFYQGEAAHTERDESVAGSKPKNQMSAFVQDDLYEDSKYEADQRQDTGEQ